MRRFGPGLLSGLLVASLLGAWSASSARAQPVDAPLFLPKSDVAVIYRLDGITAGGPRKMQVTYTLAGQRVRIDYFRWFEAKYPYLALIYDHPADRLISVQPERRAYFERPIGSDFNPGILIPEDRVFTRLGTDTVARAPCTEWKLESRGNAETLSTACVTDDGIMLRLASVKPTVGSMTATNIRYGSPPAGLFEPPEKFTRTPAP